MSVLSIFPIVMASISFYVGLYHLLIYFRRRQHRENLTFALMSLATGLYQLCCAGLYSAISVAEGAQWQRMQFIVLGFFTTAFLWFVSDYTHQKPQRATYAFSAFYLLAVLIQTVDRSNLTWMVERPSVKEILLPLGIEITYYEATFGPLTTLQSLTGLLASTYIVWSGVRFYRRGFRREAIPLLLALGFMYAAAVNDTAVSNGVYRFVYTIEYGYLTMILLMAYSLSTTVVEAAVAQEALRESEERFRSLVETTSDWVWETDRNGAYTYVSPKITELLGYEPEEITGKTPFDLMPPDEAQRLGALFRGAVASQRPIEGLENAARCKDGRLVVLETSGIPFFDADGRLLGYRGIDRDITERKRIEEALRENEARYRAVIESQVDLISRYLPDTTLTFVNDAYCQFYGKTREELIGHSYLFMIAPEFRELVRKETEDLSKAPKPLAGEYLNYRYDGKERWIQWVVQCISDENGRVVELQAVGRDITERKQAEAQLERNLRETRVRFEISQALAGAQTEEDVLDILIQQAGLYLQGAVVVQSIDPAAKELTLVTRRGAAFNTGLVIPPEGAHLTASEFPLLQYVSPDTPFVTSNLLRDERIDPVVRGLLSQMGLVSFAALPITAGTEWLGVMVVSSKEEGYFDEEKQHLCQTLAEQGAVALHAAHLREAIRESQQRLSLLVQQSPLAVIEWNTDFQVVSWNPAAERIFGYAGEEALGRHATSLIVPEQAQPLVDQVWQALLAQKGGTYSTNENLTKDGRSITCEWFNAPLVGAGGQIIGFASLVQDVTERKQMEDALRDNEERYRLLAEAAHDMIFIINREGNVDYVNSFATQQLGRLPEEIIGRAQAELFLSDDAEHQQVSLRQVFEAGQPLYVENPIQFPSRRMWLGTWLVPIKDEAGQVKSVLGVSRDITEHKRLEYETEERRLFLESILACAPDAIVTSDAQHRILEWNPGAERLFGYSSEETVGRKIDELITGADTMVFDEATGWTRQIQRWKGIPPTETVRYRKDGSSVNVIVSVAPILTGNEWVGVVAIYTDITERKRAEEALQQRQREMITLLNSLPAYAFFKDAESVYMVANRMFCDDVGCPQDEIAGKTDYDFFPEELAEKYRAEDTQVLLSRETLYIGEEDVIKEGRHVAVVTHKVPLKDENGRVVGLIGIGLDITARKRAEEELSRYRQHLEELIAERTAELKARVAEVEQLNRTMANLVEDLQAANRNAETAATRLKEVNQELTDFAYVVSHDLKAPLRGISQLAGWLSEDYSHAFDEQGQQWLGLLMERTKQMHNLIEGILQYSRIGRVKEKERDTDLNRLVDETIALLAPPQHILISVKDELPTVISEPARLAQVFQNLLSNAVKFMDKPQGKVEIGCVDEGAHWRFSVADNGPGIAPQYHDKIFLIFQTLAPRDEVESTGIGLALVKKIVETWGGRVWLESAEGQGSTFYFTLPK